MGRKTSWTDEESEELKSLIAQGYTAREIAEKLNKATRNVILGHAFRLKVKFPPRAVQGGAVTLRRRLRVKDEKTTAGPNPQPPKKMPPIKRLPGSTPRRLDDLPARSCHYAVEVDDEGEHLFCGEPATLGVYCYEHYHEAHRSDVYNKRRRSA